MINKCAVHSSCTVNHYYQIVIFVTNPNTDDPAYDIPVGCQICFEDIELNFAFCRNLTYPVLCMASAVSLNTHCVDDINFKVFYIRFLH